MRVSTLNPTILMDCLHNNFLAPSNTNVTFANHSTRKTRELCECFQRKKNIYIVRVLLEQSYYIEDQYK